MALYLKKQNQCTYLDLKIPIAKISELSSETSASHNLFAMVTSKITDHHKKCNKTRGEEPGRSGLTYIHESI